MTFSRVFLLAALLALAVAVTPAQHDDDDHDHDHHHGKLHFSHPIIVESPSPDTKVRFDYFYFRREDEDGERFVDHEGRIEAEYAFRPEFSIEVNLPYNFRRRRGMPAVGHADNMEMSFKFANFHFGEHGVLPTYGISFDIPTGSDTGVGTSHVVGVAPFAGLGYLHKRVQVIGIAELGFPANRPAGDDEHGRELEYGIATIYQFHPHFQGLLEFDGSHGFTGSEPGRSVLNISPGIKFLHGHHWQTGLSLGAPVTKAKEFKLRTVFSVFYHF
jgi:hypothetical protein